MARHAGILIPLSSAAATTSWGIGELPDLVPLAAWLADGGFDRVMLLPIGTMAAGQASPYSAQSAMAIDPIYIAIEPRDGADGVEDFARAGGAAILPPEAQRALTQAKPASRVDHASVRAAKRAALEAAFTGFLRDEWEQLTLRGSVLAAYIARERWWLHDYALFAAVADAAPGATWRDWPAPLRDREPGALDEARRRLARDVLKHQYWQWTAETQWQAARAAARERGVRVVGDLPFVVDLHSADVWVRQAEFLLDHSAGAPPDAFSATGQDWGLPMYGWDAIRATGFAWLRERATRMAALYDEFRVDHLVGFFRTYGRPPHGEPYFSPSDEPEQLRQGEDVLHLLAGAGARVIAEDLGIVPDFVRAALSRMGIPGFKVLRWERVWQAEGQPFVDPASYPAASVAMTGTHDTETLAAWWEHAPRAERALLCATPFFTERGLGDPDAGWSDPLRDALLTLVYASGSDDVFLPMQDVFGWRDRINTPATVTAANWTWRLPWPIDRLREMPEAVERARFCRTLAIATGRAGSTRSAPSTAARAPSDGDTGALEGHTESIVAEDTLGVAARERGRMSRMEYLVREYPPQHGALEIAYIEEFFNEFPVRKTAAEILKRLDGRECQILMAEAPLPDDPTTIVPVSYKVSHELREHETDTHLADLVQRLRGAVEFTGRKVLYNWLGATRRDWRGQGHFRALTEQQEVWAVTEGFDEVVVKTKNRYYDMRGTLDHLQFDVVKFEPASDNLESKVYLSKRLGPFVLDAHRSLRQVTRV